MVDRRSCLHSLARHVWAKIESLGIRKSSGLESLSKSAAWTSMSMEPIGYEEGSLRALEQLIGAHNRTRLRTEKQATFIQMMAREALARMRFLSGENFC